MDIHQADRNNEDTIEQESDENSTFEADSSGDDSSDSGNEEDDGGQEESAQKKQAPAGLKSSRKDNEGGNPGIVYLSRIPPGMTANRLRRVFEQFGAVGRLYIQQEAKQIRRARKRFGGSTRKMYTEGWVEFKEKKLAKAVARTLNNTSLGGKKRYKYSEDIWNIKYLPNFKWGHIHEKLAYERAARQQRMRTEMQQARREVSFYMENVDKGKISDAMEKRRAKKRSSSKAEEQSPAIMKTVKRKYFQRDVKPVETASGSGSNSSSSGRLVSKGLLSRVFGK